jgi:hypothetical protein
MGVCMRVLKSSLPVLTTQKNILLTGKGVCRVASANGVLYDRCPYEDPHAQTVTQGYVDVLVGDPAAPSPELDLGGVWQKAPYSVDEVFSGDTLTVLEKVEWLRNQFT